MAFSSLILILVACGLITALPSDAFILGQTLEGQSREQISRYFGADFERAVFLLKPDDWSDPLASPYGLHLVRVTHQAASPKTSPEATRAGAIEELTHEKEDANLIEALIALSILVVALEISRERSLGRPSVMMRLPQFMALFFGFLHGLGFAGQ